MNVLKKVMARLGFVSVYEHDAAMEKFRAECEEFAKDYLDASNGTTLGSESSVVCGADFKYQNIVIGSNIRFNDCNFKSIAIAPWCVRVVIDRAQVETKPVKRHRAVVRSSADKFDAVTNGKFAIGGNHANR